MLPDWCEWAWRVVEATSFQVSSCLNLCRILRSPKPQSRDFMLVEWPKSRNGTHVTSCLIRKVSTRFLSYLDRLWRDIWTMGRGWVVLIQTKLSVGFDEAWRSDVSTSGEFSVCSEVQGPTLSTDRFIRASVGLLEEPSLEPCVIWQLLPIFSPSQLNSQWPVPSDLEIALKGKLNPVMIGLSSRSIALSLRRRYTHWGQGTGICLEEQNIRARVNEKAVLLYNLH